MNISQTLTKLFFGNEMLIFRNKDSYTIHTFKRWYSEYYQWCELFNEDGNFFAISLDGEIISGQHVKTRDSGWDCPIESVETLQYENDSQFSEYLNTVVLDSALMEEYSKRVDAMKDGEKCTIYLDHDTNELVYSRLI